MAEALDIENHDALATYLRQRDSSCEIISAKTLAGGVSNRTVLVKLADGQAWVIKQALAKLRTKADWFSDPARVHREALGIRWLTKLAPPGTIPEFVFEDFENHLLAMQAVPEPHENWKEMLLAGKVELQHVRQFARLLAQIHRNAFEHSSALRDVFSDRSFFHALRLEPYYGYASEQVPAAATFLAKLIDSTGQRQITLVHGDFSPKNILVHQNQLILLDHEVIHWGDPAFDIGFALTHLLSKAHHLRSWGYFDAAQEFWRVYVNNIGDASFSVGMEEMAIQHTLGCLLARCFGRSPLEYLSPDERRIQRDVSVVLMLHSRPRAIERLISNTKGLLVPREQN